MGRAHEEEASKRLRYAGEVEIPSLVPRTFCQKVFFWC